jgi:hypothetical protein
LLLKNVSGKYVPVPLIPAATLAESLLEESCMLEELVTSEVLNISIAPIFPVPFGENTANKLPFVVVVVNLVLFAAPDVEKSDAITLAPLIVKFPFTSNKALGLVVPIPTFCDVVIVSAVVEPLVASCNTPEVSPAMLSAVPDVVPAEIIDAMYFPL